MVVVLIMLGRYLVFSDATCRDILIVERDSLLLLDALLACFAMTAKNPEGIIRVRSIYTHLTYFRERNVSIIFHFCSKARNY